MNKRFKDRAINLPEGNCDSDNSLSDNSLKETERRLSLRLNIHKQKGGRSKTSMGFYNDNSINNSSSDEEETKMTDNERMMNTRINRPKSSYVRRRHLPTEEVEDNSHVETSVPRRCRSTRPPSRIEIRDGEDLSRQAPNRHDVENHKMVLKETTYNFQAPPASPTPEFIDPAGYDRFAHTKTPVPGTETGLRRERTGLRNINANSVSENRTENGYSKAQYEKLIRSRQREDSMSELSPKRRHRRQQYNNVRASRPASENVYLVRQRTEARLIKNGNSTSNVSNRPKSDRLVMTSNGPKPILSIDHNPVSNTELGYQKNSVQQHNTTLDYKSARPMSRRGRQPQEVATRSSGVITRPPLSLMKLPPLDPTVNKRTERIALTTARETCV